MAFAHLYKTLSAAVTFTLVLAGSVLADTTATASYVVSLGGNIIATANFKFAVTDAAYDLDLNATVSGFAQLVAAGTARASSEGAVTTGGLVSNAFNLTTHSGGDEFKVQVTYANSNVSAFVVTPPIVNTLNRIPIERSQLLGVNDFLASFILKGDKLDRSLCSGRAPIFTGIERFDLNISYAKDDTATSPRTGYQGPVVRCKVKYKPISGHYTTSELTISLAQDDRILVWFAPLRDSGYFIPFRVLLTTSMGDLSMVLTSLN